MSDCIATYRAIVRNAAATDEMPSSISKPKSTMRMRAKMTKKPPRKTKDLSSPKSLVILTSKVDSTIGDIENLTDNATPSHRKILSAPPKVTYANMETDAPLGEWATRLLSLRDYFSLVWMIQVFGVCDARKARSAKSSRPS